MTSDRLVTNGEGSGLGEDTVADMRQKAGLLVGACRVAHADLLLCLVCCQSTDGGAWAELCMLVVHLLKDDLRARHTLALAVRVVTVRIDREPFDSRAGRWVHASCVPSITVAIDTRRADAWHLGCVLQVPALFLAACDGLSRHGSAGARVEGGVGQR